MHRPRGVASCAGCDQGGGLWYEEHCDLHDDEEHLSEAFFTAAVLVWEKAYSVPEVLECLQWLENNCGDKNPLNSVYKLEAIVKKCGGVAANITWAMTQTVSLYRRGDLKSEDFSLRSLEGKTTGANGKGIVDVFLEQNENALFQLAGRIGLAAAGERRTSPSTGRPQKLPRLSQIV